LIPAISPGISSTTEMPYPLRWAHNLYICMTIEAQSMLSVPPAPAWTYTGNNKSISIHFTKKYDWGNQQCEWLFLWDVLLSYSGTRCDKEKQVHTQRPGRQKLSKQKGASISKAMSDNLKHSLSFRETNLYKTRAIIMLPR